MRTANKQPDRLPVYVKIDAAALGKVRGVCRITKQTMSQFFNEAVQLKIDAVEQETGRTIRRAGTMKKGRPKREVLK